MIYFLIAQTVFQSYVFINLAPAYRTAEEKDSKKKNSFNAQISFPIILHIQKRLQIYKILVKTQPGNPLYFIKDRFIHLTIMDFRLVFAGCVTICRKNSA